MKLDFNVPSRNVKGEESKEGETLNKHLADLLGTETGKGSVVKIYGWYNQLLENGILELDEADTELLKKTIEESERTVVFIKGQYLKVLKDARENKD